MTIKKYDFIKRNGRAVSVGIQHVMPCIMAVFIFDCTLRSNSVCAQTVTPFNASELIRPGDEATYDSYIIRKIGEGISHWRWHMRPPD